MKCGLLGEKLGHSQSPEIHKTLGDYEYRLYEKRPEAVEDFLRHGEYDVLNVTIPYKKVAFALCDEVTPVARKLGNVNVVVKRLDGKLWGDNTDAYGFRKLVESVGVDIRGRKCVVLGTGGAAMTVRAVLEERGAARVSFVRRGELPAQDDVLIVNAKEPPPEMALLAETLRIPLARTELSKFRAAVDGSASYVFGTFAPKKNTTTSGLKCLSPAKSFSGDHSGFMNDRSSDPATFTRR